MYAVVDLRTCAQVLTTLVKDLKKRKISALTNLDIGRRDDQTSQGSAESVNNIDKSTSRRQLADRNFWRVKAVRVFVMTHARAQLSLQIPHRHGVH